MRVWGIFSFCRCSSWNKRAYFPSTIFFCLHVHEKDQHCILTVSEMQTKAFHFFFLFEVKVFFGSDDQGCMVRRFARERSIYLIRIFFTESRRWVFVQHCFCRDPVDRKEEREWIKCSWHFHERSNDAVVTGLPKRCMIQCWAVDTSQIFQHVRIHVERCHSTHQ
jgi:hypothetical protein